MQVIFKLIVNITVNLHICVTPKGKILGKDFKMDPREWPEIENVSQINY